jgi:iron complex outermembrane receptor protein
VTAAVFRIDTKDEIVTNGSTGGRTDYRNASRTRRDGLELLAESSLGADFDAIASATWLDARFRDGFASGTPAVAVPAGARLPGVPPVVLYAEFAWRPVATGFHAAIEARHSGKLYVNDANTDAASASTVVNLRSGFEHRLGGWRFSEFVRVDNVTDRRYVGSVIVAESRGRYFEPATGRNALVGITASHSF